MYEEICFIEGFVFGIISGVAVSKMDDDNNSGNVFSRSVLTCIGSWIGYYCVSYLVKSSYYYDEHGLTIFLIMTAFVAIFYVFFFIYLYYRYEKKNASNQIYKRRNLIPQYPSYPCPDIPYPTRNNDTVFYTECAISYDYYKLSPFYYCMIWGDSDYIYITPVKSMKAGEKHIARIALYDIKYYYTKKDEPPDDDKAHSIYYIYKPRYYEKKDEKIYDLNETYLIFKTGRKYGYVKFTEDHMDDLKKIVGERKIGVKIPKKKKPKKAK